MAITLQQAQQAGQAAGMILQLQKGVDDITAAIAGDAIIQQMTASTSVGPLTFSLPISPADSATILNAVSQVMSSNLAALNASLAAIGSS